LKNSYGLQKASADDTVLLAESTDDLQKKT
jgi:hypothetical protein